RLLHGGGRLREAFELARGAALPSRSRPRVRRAASDHGRRKGLHGRAAGGGSFDAARSLVVDVAQLREADPEAERAVILSVAKDLEMDNIRASGDPSQRSG